MLWPTETRRDEATPRTSCAFTLDGKGVLFDWYAHLIALTTWAEIICLVVTSVKPESGRKSEVWDSFLIGSAFAMKSSIVVTGQMV